MFDFCILMYVVQVTFGDGCGFSLVGSHLSNFKINRLDPGVCYLSVSPFFGPSFLHVSMAFKCTKHVGPNSDVV